MPRCHDEVLCARGSYGLLTQDGPRQTDTQNVRNRFKLMVACAGLVVTTASCGGAEEATEPGPDLAYIQESGEEATTAPTFVQQDLLLDLSDEEETLVAFEAAWVCAVQSQTFDTNGAISNALEDRLAEAGIDEQTYGEFRQSLNQNENLRVAIMAIYQADCSGN